MPSISGVHLIIESENPDADAAFFRDTMAFKHVDAGSGFLIFRLPPAEAAFHPVDSSGDDKSRNGIFLMCNDLKKEMANLRSKGIKCSKPINARWGTVTKIQLPSGIEIGLYQPKHVRPE
ncbi:MAG: extradiol dioxygenase [Nitrososphaera sp.]